MRWQILCQMMSWKMRYNTLMNTRRECTGLAKLNKALAPAATVTTMAPTTPAAPVAPAAPTVMPAATVPATTVTSAATATPVTSAATATSTVAGGTSGTDPPGPSARVKLPKITLPRFNGNLMKWTAFWDSYHSAIHTNGQLSEIDKFNYLRSLLDHTAYDAIAGLALSAANYQEAVEVLKKRFGNRQLIISKHMEALLSVATISSDHQLRDLRRLYDQAEANIRSLKALGVEPASYGTMLSSVLLTKLPPEMRLIVSQKVSSADLDMDSLLTTFEQELTARERATNSSSQSQHPPRRQTQPPTSALFAGTQGTPCCTYFIVQSIVPSCQMLALGRKFL